MMVWYLRILVVRLCIDKLLKVAEWMASSSSLFIGIDKSTKSTKRSFVEIEIGGQLCSTDPDLHIWCVPLTTVSAKIKKYMKINFKIDFGLIIWEPSWG